MLHHPKMMLHSANSTFFDQNRTVLLTSANVRENLCRRAVFSSLCHRRLPVINFPILSKSSSSGSNHLGLNFATVIIIFAGIIPLNGISRLLVSLVVYPRINAPGIKRRSSQLSSLIYFPKRVVGGWLREPRASGGKMTHLALVPSFFWSYHKGSDNASDKSGVSSANELVQWDQPIVVIF